MRYHGINKLQKLIEKNFGIDLDYPPLLRVKNPNGSFSIIKNENKIKLSLDRRRQLIKRGYIRNPDISSSRNDHINEDNPRILATTNNNDARISDVMSSRVSVGTKV